MAEILSQCFDVLKTYGKEPESLENMHRAFMFTLEDYSAQQIQKAFISHLKTSSEIPTPADIIKHIEVKKAASGPAYQVYRGDDLPDPLPRNSVPWAGKNWIDMGEDLQRQCINHIGFLTKTKGKERALGYIDFLQQHCGAPANLKERVFA